MNKALSNSQSVEWETPKEFFNEIDAVYHFDTDVCATATNAKCRHYFSPEEDGLQQPWRGVCWMNPPYGSVRTGQWVEKAYNESKSGVVVVALLPARTDTKWFHRFVYKQKGVDMQFIKGRLRFGDGRWPAPFPSIFVVFNGKEHGG